MFADIEITRYYDLETHKALIKKIETLIKKQDVRVMLKRLKLKVIRIEHVGSPHGNKDYIRIQFINDNPKEFQSLHRFVLTNLVQTLYDAKVRKHVIKMNKKSRIEDSERGK